MTLKELLNESFDLYSLNVALVEDDVDITYSELHCACNDNDRILSKHTLVNENIGIFIEHNIEAVIAILSCVYSYRVYVPLDPETPTIRLQHILEMGNIKTIITTEDLYQDLLNATKDNDLNVFVIKNGKIKQFETEKVVPKIEKTFSVNDNAYILFTSGSTGTPKGVIVSHKAALAFINWSSEYIQIHSTDNILSVAPFFFDMSVFDIYATLKSGATLHISNKTSIPQYIVPYINDNITICYAVPTFYINIMTQVSEEDPLKIDKLIYAGEEFPIREFNRLLNICNAEIYNFYGPTETNVITYFHVDRELNWEHNIPIGTACPYANIKLSTNGNVGEILVKSESLMSGYTSKEMERNIWCDDYYCTGDIVKKVDDDNFLFLCRKDDLVKINGYRVELGEIKQAILEIPSIINSEVVFVSNENGKKIHAFFTAKESVESKHIREKLSKFLPRYMIPQQITQLISFPMKNNGKIDKQGLVNIAQNMTEKARIDTKEIYSQKSIFETIYKLLQKYVVDISFVKKETALSETGIESLAFIKFLSELEGIYQFKFTVADLLNSKSWQIKDLISILENKLNV